MPVLQESGPNSTASAESTATQAAAVPAKVSGMPLRQYKLWWLRAYVEAVQPLHALMNQIYLEDQQPPLDWDTINVSQFFAAHQRVISGAEEVDSTLHRVAEELVAAERAVHGAPLAAPRTEAAAAADRQGALVPQHQKRARRQRQRAADGAGAEAHAPHLVPAPADADQPAPAAPDATATPSAAVELVRLNSFGLCVLCQPSCVLCS